MKLYAPYVAAAEAADEAETILWGVSWQMQFPDMTTNLDSLILSAVGTRIFCSRGHLLPAKQQWEATLNL